LRGQEQFIFYFLLQRGSEKRKPRVRAQYEHISMAVSGQPVLGSPALQTDHFLPFSYFKKSSVTNIFSGAFFISVSFLCLSFGFSSF
jgi:hypothetical protein